MPVKPRTPATRATIRNTKAHDSMISSLLHRFTVALVADAAARTAHDENVQGKSGAELIVFRADSWPAEPASRMRCPPARHRGAAADSTCHRVLPRAWWSRCRYRAGFIHGERVVALPSGAGCHS